MEVEAAEVAGRVSGRESEGWDIVGDDGSGSDDRIFAEGDAFEDGGVCTDEDRVSDVDR